MDDECGGDKWLWCLRLWYFRSLGDIWLFGGVLGQIVRVFGMI